MRVAVVLLGALAFGGAYAEEAEVALLVFTQGNGADQVPAAAAATDAIQALAAEEGWAAQVTDTGDAFTADTLAEFAAVVWNTVSGEALTLSQRAAFKEYMEGGGGFAGLHSSGEGLAWDWYAEALLGAQFIGYPDAPRFQDALVLAEPTASGISQGMPADWTLNDEWHSFASSPRLAGATIVASLDERSYAPRMQSGKDLRMGDHPIAWTRCVAEGRAFYSAIGHRSEVYADPHYLELLREGLRWAAGKGLTVCRKVKGEDAVAFSVMAIKVGETQVLSKRGGPSAFHVVTDPITHLDPDLRDAVRALSIPAPQTPKELRRLNRKYDKLAAPVLEARPINGETLADFRTVSMEEWFGEPLDEPPYEERRIPGAPGQPEVVIYVINARPGEARPAMLHTHGGGYVLGSAKGSVPNLQALAAEYDIPIVTVEYRLAPETAFPGSLEDNYAALKWLHANAEALGADPARIVLMGESAGGGHAAALALAARDRGEVPVSRQLLIYPMLDDRTGSSVPVPEWLGYYNWNTESNRFGWSSLLGVPAGSDEAPIGAVPARVPSLAGLPPAFIIVGTADLFVLEDVAYGQRLMRAGVPVELVVVPGAYHGSEFQQPAAASSKMLIEARAAAYARAFAR